MEKFICVFCETEMSVEQVICCDTYKGKMSLDEFNEIYN